VLNALAAAGGPTKNGTLRSIQVKRNGKLVETVDLYAFFLRGDKSRDIRLQAGDTIFVPAIGPVAGIAGNVRNPAIYELKNEKTLRELLALAEGIKPTGYLQRVQISRIAAHEKKVVSDVSLDAGKSGKSLDELTGAIGIQDLDMVRVFPIDTTLRGYARLEGYVLRPGDYTLTPGLRVSSILGQDNLLPEYYSEAGQITRLIPPDLHPEVIFFNVAKAMAGDPAQDLELQEYDRVRIFSRPEMEELPYVRVSGDVQKPGQFRHFSTLTVRDLLRQAGNPRQTAYLKSAEITRLKKTGEAVSSYSLNISLDEAIKGNPEHNLALMPFDELYVRRIPNWSEETDRYVTLKGEFVFPGVYPVYRGERLSSVIRRAGGFSDKAFLRGAKYTRLQLKEQQQKRMDEYLARAEVDLVKKQGELASTASSKEELEATRTAMANLMKSMEILKRTKAEGRMVFRLTSQAELEHSASDIEVLGGDVLEVPSDPKVVSVMGQVYSGSSFMYTPGVEIRDYLAKAGGMTQDAEEDDIYVVKADGSVLSRQMASGGFLGFGGFLTERAESGDTIVVPQQYEKIAWMREIKDIAMILGQIALVGGVLIAAGM
jgi:protein involved in polysaccharide export with SLBB domain